MKRHWGTDELVEHWTLLPRETELLTNKTGATRLGFAVLLKFFQLEAYFPQQASAVPTVVVEFVAKRSKSHRSNSNSISGAGALLSITVHRFASCTASGKRQLMIQQVLHKPQWKSRMRSEDLRALTPLIYSHVTPYGRFRLDMNERLVIETAVAA
jgi:hypothetical protein